MSGGAFDYQQYRIGEIADDIQAVIRREEELYKPETIRKFKDAIRALRIAEVYAQRIDWLLSGDDGEETFHGRLSEDLNKFSELKNHPIEWD